MASEENVIRDEFGRVIPSEYFKNKQEDDKEWRRLKPFFKHLRGVIGNSKAKQYHQLILTTYVDKRAELEEWYPNLGEWWTAQEIQSKAEFRLFRPGYRETLTVALSCGYVFVPFYCFSLDKAERGPLVCTKVFDVVDCDGYVNGTFETFCPLTLNEGAVAKIRLLDNMDNGLMLRIPKVKTDPILPQTLKDQISNNQLPAFEKNKAIALCDNEWRNADQMNEYLADKQETRPLGEMLNVSISRLIEKGSMLGITLWSEATIRKHTHFRFFDRDDKCFETLPSEISFDQFVVPLVCFFYALGPNGQGKDGFEKVTTIDGEVEETTLQTLEPDFLSAGQMVHFRLKDGCDFGFLARIPKLKADNAVRDDSIEARFKGMDLSSGRMKFKINGVWLEDLQGGNVSRKERTCQGCGITWKKSMDACSRCHKVKYCSKTCQRADWKNHKADCFME